MTPPPIDPQAERTLGGQISTPIQDPLLLQAERRIEGNMLPSTRKNYLKIVTAGMRTLLDKGTNGILYKLKYSKDPMHDCAVGAVMLTLLMRKQSKGTMPLQAMVPAAMTLMLKALDFAEKGGLLKVDEPLLVKATHIFTNTLFKEFKISPQMLHHAAGKLHSMTQDPETLDKIKQSAGAMPIQIPQHPMASLINSRRPPNGL